jgi:hypothetical protein
LLYNIVIGGLMAIGIVGSIWATVRIEQARKAGKIRYIGKTKIK